MTVSTAVKWATSNMIGAPVLPGVAGGYITLLDAFLLNGFGTKAVDSAVVTSGICRMNITGASAALDHAVVTLAGVTGAGVGLNGNQRVKTATAGYVEFACSLPDGPLTGTITFKIAPLGWEKVFSKTNVAVYRSTDPAGTRPYLRVDDTNALYARVTMYESMSDVDTGVSASPAPAILSGGYYWHKRQAAAATGVFWALVGDARGFYCCPAPASSAAATNHAGYAVVPQWAGDIRSDRSGDAWCAALTGALSTTYSAVDGDVMQTGSASGRCLMRSSFGLGGSVISARDTWSAGISGLTGGQGAYPSRAGNSLRVSEILLTDGAVSEGPRGALPGAYHCTQSGVAASMPMGFVQRGDGALLGRNLLAVHVGYPQNASGQGVGFFDITGPWRD